ncbi:MAG: TraB/GumN family protein [Proteobacteria bacterium]|nr:TraB/GumN family protein [Pseudomonadota bacterium]
MSDAGQTAAEARGYPRDVHILTLDGREIILIGTAHVSRESADLVRDVIEKERPDVVCIELDPRRFEALSEKNRFESLDLRQIIRQQQLTTLFANLLLASYQKKLGGKLGVTPGAELLEAAQTAAKLDIPVALCDRDIRITLRRAWRAMSFWKKSLLASNLMVGSLERPDLDEEELRRIREQDVLSELMQELGEAMPDLKRVLIDERDAYLAHKILESDGRRIVAVVGAGHVQGMLDALRERREADLAELEHVPPVSPAWKWVGWSVPTLILGSLAWIGWSQGADAVRENAQFWFLANAVPCALGAVAAMAHPATVAAGFMAAPFTSLTPVIGAGYVAAFVQVWFTPPVVNEFQSVGDDVSRPRRWWGNRLLRVFLVFVFTTLGSLLGNFVGGAEILSQLF